MNKNVWTHPQFPAFHIPAALFCIAFTLRDITNSESAYSRATINKIDSQTNSNVWYCATLSIYIYHGCTTWTLTKRLKKKLDGNYTRMLRAILNKSWRQHPTRHQLYGHLPPITKIIQVRRTGHAEHCWRSKDELISDVLLWTPAYSPSKSRTTSSNIHTASMWSYRM